MLVLPREVPFSFSFLFCGVLFRLGETKPCVRQRCFSCTKKKRNVRKRVESVQFVCLYILIRDSGGKVAELET